MERRSQFASMRARDARFVSPTSAEYLLLLPIVGGDVNSGLLTCFSFFLIGRFNRWKSRLHGCESFPTSIWVTYVDTSTLYCGRTGFFKTQPEVLRGKAYTFSVDYWSLGCILFEFLSGFPPFSGATPEETWTNLKNWTKVLQRPIYDKPEDLVFNLRDISWDIITR
jgi:hypothetical protein